MSLTPRKTALPVTAYAACLAVLLAGCSQQPPPGLNAASPLPPATAESGPPASAASAAAPPASDAATRTAPLVPGRPGRVFIFAGVGKSCEPLPAPAITISAPPQQGAISFRPGQETTIAASAQGTCAGAKATGTGVYYTAREGASGTDTFALTARLASGETMVRTFSVTIAQ